MLDLAGLATAAIAFLVVAASPGPATIAVATISMRAGRRPGLRFGIGLSVGLAFWGLVAATGMAALLQASASALATLKLLGGAYLLWLASGSARSAMRAPTSKTGHLAEGRWFRRGLLLNLSNPKAVLAWMATLALGIGDEGGFWQAGSVTLLCITFGFGIYAVYALAFSTSGAMNGYQRLRRWIDGIASAVFALSGIGLIRSAIARS